MTRLSMLSLGLLLGLSACEVSPSEGPKGPDEDSSAGSGADQESSAEVDTAGSSGGDDTDTEDAGGSGTESDAGTGDLESEVNPNDDASETGDGEDHVADGGESGDADVVDTVSSDTTVSDTTVSDTTVSDTTASDTTVSDTTPSDTTVADTTASDTTVADTGSGTDAGPVDVGPPPCSTGPDLDEDGIVDECDRCPYMPKVLIYELFSEYNFGRNAVARRGCEYEVADISNFTERLESGDFRLVLMDMPDARPSGEWAIALRDFIIDGGGVVMATHRLSNVPGTNLPASFGATWGAEFSSPQTFTPTWVVPIHQRPNELRNATYQPSAAAGYTWWGAPLSATAGRIWGRFGTGGAIVESNGGRTFLNGFLLDAYPGDRDSDGTADMVELIENQLISVSMALRPPMDWAAPVVSNFGPSTIVRYRMPILRGTVDPRAYDAIVWNGKDDFRSWPAGGRHFKALVPLRPGENWVTLESAGIFTHLELDFVPQTNPRKVRFAYVVPKNDNGNFDAPHGEPNGIGSAQKRIGLGAELLQAMLADRLHNGGLGRHTFNLVTDANHQPIVHVWNSSLTRAEWQNMTDYQMYDWINNRLHELPACGDCRTVAIVAASHWDAAAGKALAHGALGGGSLAMFGSVTLYSWAETLDDIVYRLSDDTEVSSLSPPVMDDSGLRGRVWANYATGLGAVLHELSHALDLLHAIEYRDIVTRGFDHVNRLIMSSEPPSDSSYGYSAFTANDEVTYNAAGLGRLRWHRFTALDVRAYNVNSPPQVNQVGNEIRITTSAGLRVIGYSKWVPAPPPSMGGEWKTVTANLETGANAPTDYVIYKSTLSFMFPNEPKIRLNLTDDQGNINDNFIVYLP
jgi:hypothetical protein